MKLTHSQPQYSAGAVTRSIVQRCWSHGKPHCCLARLQDQLEHMERALVGDQVEQPDVQRAQAAQVVRQHAQHTHPRPRQLSRERTARRCVRALQQQALQPQRVACAAPGLPRLAVTSSAWHHPCYVFISTKSTPAAASVCPCLYLKDAYTEPCFHESKGCEFGANHF